MTVDDRRARKILCSLAHHANRSARESLTKHHACGARLKDVVNRLKNFIWCASDVRRKNQPQPIARFPGALYGPHREPCAVSDRRITQIGIKVFIFLYKNEERTTGHAFDQVSDLLRGDSCRRLQDCSESWPARR